MTDTDIILYLTVSTTALFLTTICFFAMYVLKRNEAKSHKSLFPSYEKQIEALGEFKSKCVAAMAESAELKLRLQKSDDYNKELRKSFIEQSELATSWRQRYDEFILDFSEICKRQNESNLDYEDKIEQLKKDLDRFKENFNDQFDKRASFQSECLRLESEIRFGNETIEWLKADLKRAYDLLFQNEKVILELLLNGKFPDEKGNYKVNRLSRNGVTFEAGEYLHSLYESKIAQQQFEHKNKSEHKSKEKRPKGWNLKVAPRDKAGRVMKMSERIVLEPIDIKINETPDPKPVRHLREVNEENKSKFTEKQFEVFDFVMEREDVVSDPTTNIIRHGEKYFIDCQNYDQLRVFLMFCRANNIKWFGTDWDAMENKGIILKEYPMRIGVLQYENGERYIGFFSDIDVRSTYHILDFQNAYKSVFSVFNKNLKMLNPKDYERIVNKK